MALSAPYGTKLIGFVFSLLCSVVTGIYLSFNVYAVPLKSIFNFTQSQVELVASASIAGAALSAIGPLIFARFGYKTIWTVIFVTVIPGTLLFGMSVVKSELFRDWPSLVCLFQFIMSSGNEMAYFTLLAIGVGNFDKKSAGGVTGFYGAASASGKAFFGVVYQLFFEKTQDLGSFFFTIVLLNIALLPMCFLFHNPHAPTGTDEGAPLISDIEIVNQETAHDSDSTSTMSLMKMFQSLYFNLLFWPSVFFYASAFTFMNNVTILAKAEDLHQPLNLVYVLTGILISVRLSTGILYDRFQSIALGFGLLFVDYATFITAMIIAITNENSITVYVVTTLCGFGMGMGLMVPSILLSEEFGVQNMGIISGLFFSAQSVLNILLQTVVGFLYDDAKFQQHSLGVFCHGKDCFLWIWVMLITITILVTICEVVNFSYAMYLRYTCGGK